MLTTLAIFDCIFITMASATFSLPLLSSYWQVEFFTRFTWVSNKMYGFMVLSAFVFLVRSIPSLDGAKRSLINIQVWVHPHVFPWFLPIIQISLNGSIWSTVSVTVERSMVYIIFNLIQLKTEQWMPHAILNLTKLIHIWPVQFILYTSHLIEAVCPLSFCM